MSQVIGKLLPNLTVTLDEEEIEMKDLNDVECLSAVENSEAFSNSVKQDVQINSAWMSNFQKPKLYPNLDGGFSTGLDLISEENSKVLEKRAERFGCEIEVTASETVLELYESLKIAIEDRNSTKFKSLRLDAIHMRGVEEMNTKDIFDYFKDYGPSGIEWINDYTCNVLWLDESTSARALLGLSKPHATKQMDIKSNQPGIVSGAEIEEHDCKNGKIENEDEKEIKDEENDQTKDAVFQLPTEIDIPVPPGLWRLGIQHQKAKAILLRFATIEDKKKPGSEKRSNYYKKYGNPNYGGLKGLISSSWKKKAQAESNRCAVKLGSDMSLELPPDDSPIPRRVKTVRMRMYADDEEFNKTSRFEQEKQYESVHHRLGTKYTKDDLCKVGKYLSPHTHTLHREEDPYKSMHNERKRSMPVDCDLRNKIKKLKDDNSSKHRSPLWRD